MKDMSKKKFDLELALAGHPLVTRNGKKVVYFGKNDNDMPFKYTALFENGVNGSTYTANGEFNESQTPSSYDLFLVDAEWYSELRIGDTIQVSFPDSDWTDAVFINHGVDGKITCACGCDADQFHKGHGFTASLWDSKNWRRKPKTQDIKIEFTLNGEPFDINELSDESILKLIKTKQDEK